MATIRKIYCEEKKSPFCVVYTNKKKRISRFFESEQEREGFIATHSFLKDEGFKDFLEMSPQVITDVVAISKLLPADVSFMDMYKFWQKAHKSIPVMTVFEACDAYVRDMRKIGREESHIVRVRRILESFCDTFGDHFLSSLKKFEIEDWLDSLPFQGQTKQNYKSIITATFNFFLKNDWIEKNIASNLRCEQPKAKEIGILSVSEAEQLLRANEDVAPEITGLIALGLFAGMRSSAIARVEYSELNFKDRGIETPAHKTKKGRRQFIENLPDNLWAWLERTPPTAFDMCERKFKKRREIAYRRAGLLCNSEDVKRLRAKGEKATLKLPPHNAFRHSFVSYHVALHRNFTDTALIISHRGTDILFEHYLGVAKKDDAQKYFDIYPKDYLKHKETA